MKTLDADISNLIKQSKNLNHRAVILLTGDNRLKKLGVVCNLIEKLGTKNILYCYVKDNKKRKIDANGKKRTTICHKVQLILQKHCPSEIRWCLYKNTQSILGRTFDICIFQDFETLTPNVIARGMETVAGGGLVIFLAPALTDLESYFNTAYNASLQHISNAQRFLKRFAVSLIASKICVCIDDQFNLLNKKKKPIKFRENASKGNSVINRDLICLKESLKLSDSAFYPMVNMCATLDQARCLRTLCAAIRQFHQPSNRDDNDERRAVTALVTAARGRGKSAALGLALCAALETGLTQICVTAPSAENVGTVWQYVILGLKALNYTEHIDFKITTSYLEDSVKAVTKVVTKVELKRSKFAQVIRYVEPSETESIDCDLLCIDEAAAIPTGVLQMYLTSFRGLVFVASTISGYEGSGMMLATALVERLRTTHEVVVGKGTESAMELTHDNSVGKLYEITLEEPIRYGNGDPVESFLFSSLCMSYKGVDDGNLIPELEITPEQCHLAVINRDVLFNSTKSSERMLQRIMAIYSASNHQNSPDDLKSLADNEWSRLLCLTDSSLDGTEQRVLVLIEVNYEGDINREYVRECIRQSGVCPTVDTLSNALVEEFLEPKFKSLSGLRINLIATAPDCLDRGFGSRALQLLMDFVVAPIVKRNHDFEYEPCQSLLMPLQTLPNVSLHYVGIYSNLNVKLIKFFQRIADFMVVYVDPELNEITGECRGILVKRIPRDISPDHVYSYNWLALFRKFFLKRFSLLRHGNLRALSDEYKALLDKSSNPDIEQDIENLPNENIMSYLVCK